MRRITLALVVAAALFTTGNGAKPVSVRPVEAVTDGDENELNYFQVLPRTFGG